MSLDSVQVHGKGGGNLVSLLGVLVLSAGWVTGHTCSDNVASFCLS
jgi:hypothetical protein